MRRKPLSHEQRRKEYILHLPGTEVTLSPLTDEDYHKKGQGCMTHLNSTPMTSKFTRHSHFQTSSIVTIDLWKEHIVMREVLRDSFLEIIIIFHNVEDKEADINIIASLLQASSCMTYGLDKRISKLWALLSLMNNQEVTSQWEHCDL